MNKGKFLLSTSFFLMAIFIVFVTFNILDFGKMWFSLSMFMVGIYAIVYSFLYKLDSAYYYGILLILLAVATAIRWKLQIGFGLYYPMYVFVVAISHLAVFVRFRQNIHYKVFAILALQGILLISFKFNAISLAVVLALSAVLWLIVFASIMFRLRRNLRRE